MSAYEKRREKKYTGSAVTQSPLALYLKSSSNGFTLLFLNFLLIMISIMLISVKYIKSPALAPTPFTDISHQSKEDLLFSILDEKISEIGVLVREYIKGIESTKEILRKIFWVTMDYYDRNPGVAVTAFITVPMRTWMKERSYRRDDASAILEEVVKSAHERGDIDPAIRTSQILDQYYMYCYRQIHLWYFNNMTTKLVDRIPAFFDILWKTLSPPEHGS